MLTNSVTLKMTGSMSGRIEEQAVMKWALTARSENGPFFFLFPGESNKGRGKHKKHKSL
jgi:hypothetical protein